MKAPRMIVSAAAVLLWLAACSPSGPAGPSTGPSDDGSGVLGTGTTSPTPTQTETDVVSYEVTYPFGAPEGTIEVSHSPAGPPVLTGVYVADHPDGDPAYQRLSFYFRGGFPSYHFGYAAQIVEEGSGDPLVLAGPYLLSIVFSGAYAHDPTTYEPSVVATPARPLGLAYLVDLVPSGDWEGQVSYGVGLDSPSAGSPALRVGELERADGSGGYIYVVHVDVRAE